MGVIEIMRFRLRPDAAHQAFEAADRRLQTEFAYRQPGMLRRTVARAADGEWIVIDLWHTGEDADRAALAWEDDASAAAFMHFVDAGTVSVARFDTLD
jgi:hypothetical protein